MALHLNLFHEIEKERLAKRRDPLKLSLMGMGVMAAFFAGYYFWELNSMSSVAQEFARKKADFDSLSPKADAAQKHYDELLGVLKAGDQFVKRIEGRFYWAPMLEALARVVPADLQLTHFSGDVQGDTVRKCNLSIDGVASGPSPRKSAETLRLSLEQEFSARFKIVNATFRTLEDGAEVVGSDGRPHPTAIFQISVQLATGVEAPPPPPKKFKPKVHNET